MMNIEATNRTVVAVCGFSSEVGKTTLLCELLSAFPGWEAIKMTRGHYRSCGKSAEACCVSHLLSAEPVIYSGRERNYAPGKDTGRYWDAGASNVHWVIVTDAQVEQGIEQALARVRAAGVFIEGNSFLKFVRADFTVMVARASGGKIKPSARRALKQADALYLFDDAGDLRERERFAVWREHSADAALIPDLPVYTRADLPRMAARLRELHPATAVFDDSALSRS
jgi:molybdopterin-guanine dinucleotide biosynthesis protein